MFDATLLRRAWFQVLWVMLCPILACAQDAPQRDARLIPLTKTIRSFAAAYNANDATALAMHFTATGEYTDEAGTLFKGRKSIEAEFAAFFKVRPGSQMTIAVDDIRFIGESMAIEEGTATVSQRKAKSVTVSRYLVVHALGKNG